MTGDRRLLASPALLVALVWAAAGCGTTTAASESSPGALPSVAAARPEARPSGFRVHEAAGEAPDPDGMDLKLEQGFIGREEADEAIRRRFAELRRCYDQAGPARDFAGGPVTLRFLVATSGRASDVLVVDSRLGHFAVERCLIAVGRQIPFPRPQGGPATVEYTVEFRATGSRPVIDLAVTDVEPEIARQMPRLAAECERLGADLLSATLYIEARGAVRSVGFAAQTPVDAVAVECVSSVMRRWSIPVEALRGGRALGRVTVALRHEDLVAPAKPSRPARTAAARLTQGRRPPRGSALR